HRLMDYCRQVHAEYADDLVIDGDGQAAWPATQQGLGEMDRLVKGIKIPAGLQRLLSVPNALDRKSLAQAAAMLKQEATSLHQQLEIVARDYDMSEVQDDSSAHIRVTAT